MRAAFGLFYWEILKKNQLVFPILAILLAFGAGVAAVYPHLAPDSVVRERLQSLTFLAFIPSLLIASAPFMLAENGGGWRTNSLLTRWFALPLGTPALVLLPLAAACILTALLTGIWCQVIRRVGPSLDGLYLAGVLITAQVFFNAVAWTVPRRPAQFWIAVGVLLPIALAFALGPQDSRNFATFRAGAFVVLGIACVLMLGYTLLAARQVRHGYWPGEIPISLPSLFSRIPLAKSAVARSARIALFSLGSQSSLRLLAFSWLALAIFVYIYSNVSVRESQPELMFSRRLFLLMVTGFLPALTIPVLAFWSLFTAGEPSAAFRTRLGSFKASLPVSTARLAGDKVILLTAAWLFLWLPISVALFWADGQGWPMLGGDPQSLFTFQARMMAYSAFLAAGALPVLLWGRLEGFAGILLATSLSWLLLWGLVNWFPFDPPTVTPLLWCALALALAAKFGSGLYALIKGIRNGHASGCFAGWLVIGWLIVAAVILFGLKLYPISGLWASGVAILLIPFARLAWCPLAIAANRHR